MVSRKREMYAVLDANPNNAAACQAISRYLPYYDNFVNNLMKRAHFIVLVEPVKDIPHLEEDTKNLRAIVS